MDQTNPPPNEQNRATETLPWMGMPGMMLGYAETTRSMIWAVENVRVMLELNRTLLDLSRQLFRQQQDVAIETTLRALKTSMSPDASSAEASFTDFARLGFEAFDRVTEAMRIANDAARGKPAAEGKRAPG